jgi:hypothetical protein
MDLGGRSHNEWAQPMAENGRDCIHGSLARKCELCERDEEIHDLTRQLKGAVEALRLIESVLDDGKGDKLSRVRLVVNTSLYPHRGQ